MEKSQYISIMIQSLKKKSAVLDTIMELNIQQKEELENPALDPDDFDRTVEKKAEQIQQLELLDNGFQELYEKVREELQSNREAYREDIACMQEYIRKLTDKSATIQAQIMALLRNLQKESGMSMILITHDIGLVASMADRVIVMYAGQMIEEAPVKELFAAPAHPYTKALLQTVPGIYDEKDRELVAIPGMVPENYDSIPGCRFADRCAFRTKGCDQPQSYRQIGEGHFVRCMLAKEGET